MVEGKEPADWSKPPRVRGHPHQVSTDAARSFLAGGWLDHRDVAYAARRIDHRHLLPTAG